MFQHVVSLLSLHFLHNPSRFVLSFLLDASTLRSMHRCPSTLSFFFFLWLPLSHILFCVSFVGFPYWVHISSRYLSVLLSLIDPFLLGEECRVRESTRCAKSSGDQQDQNNTTLLIYWFVFLLYCLTVTSFCINDIAHSCFLLLFMCITYMCHTLTH